MYIRRWRTDGHKRTYFVLKIGHTYEEMLLLNCGVHYFAPNFLCKRSCTCVWATVHVFWLLCILLHFHNIRNLLGALVSKINWCIVHFLVFNRIIWLKAFSCATHFIYVMKFQFNSALCNKNEIKHSTYKARWLMIPIMSSFIR